MQFSLAKHPALESCRKLCERIQLRRGHHRTDCFDIRPLEKYLDISSIRRGRRDPYAPPFSEEREKIDAPVPICTKIQPCPGTCCQLWIPFPALETPGYCLSSRFGFARAGSTGLGSIFADLHKAFVLGCIISRFAADLSFGLSIVRQDEVRCVVPTSPKIGEKWGTRQAGAR
jgi:hypothetical protein